MSTLRTFVAIDASPEIRSAASRLIERLRVARAKVTWTKAANLHYTLKFLGDVPAEETPAICRAVQEAVAPFTPFEAVCFGAGAFPSIGRPRTIWLGMSDGVEAMEMVFQAVEKSLAKLHYPVEHRRFSPHLTLGRVRESSPAGMHDLGELLRKHADFDAGAMSVNSATVYSSILSRDGPSYQVLSTAEFGG